MDCSSRSGSRIPSSTKLRKASSSRPRSRPRSSSRERTRKSLVRSPRSSAASDRPSPTKARESSTLVSRSAGKPARLEASNGENGQTEVARPAAYAPPLPATQESHRKRGASTPRRVPLAQAHLRAAGRRRDSADPDDRDRFRSRGEADREVGGSWKAHCRKGERRRGQARSLRQSWIQIPWPREGCGRRSPRRRVGVLNGRYRESRRIGA